jgi:hypothetical protein
MSWALYAVAGVLAIAALVVVAGVGKPADKVKPTTGGQAAAVVVVNAAMIVIVVLAATRLSLWPCGGSR